METTLFETKEQPTMFKSYATIEHEGRQYVDLEAARHIIKERVTEIYRKNGNL